MTGTEYYKNYKLSRKLNLPDLTWIVFILVTVFASVVFGRGKWPDSWFVVIPLCLVWGLFFCILMGWCSAKKCHRFNLSCPSCQHDLGNSVGMTIATGKCQKCGRDLFDPDATIVLPPYLDKTKMQLLEFRRKMSRWIWWIVTFWTVVFLALCFLSFFNGIYLNVDLTGETVGGLMMILIIGGLYLVAFLQNLQARREGFVCPACKVVICHGCMEIVLKTGRCSRCGKKLFADE
jgi:uncharacterized membrane protein (DUF485 family)